MYTPKIKVFETMYSPKKMCPSLAQAPVSSGPIASSILKTALNIPKYFFY